MTSNAQAGSVSAARGPAPGPAPVGVLVVEDDATIRRAVQLALERYGYRVDVAADGLSGLEAFRAGAYDLLILDVMLPELDGIGLCHRIREESPVPVLMMSARGDALDVVAGLEAGADDYVIKPVDTAVMVARIRALLRRATFRPDTESPASEESGRDRAPDHVLTFGDLTVDTLGMEVRRAGATVSLTPTELRLLLEFAAAPGSVLDRRRLLRDVWDYGWEGDTRVVDLCVLRLRKKIGSGRIETVRGFGYKLVRG
ncbi:two-component system response regulator CseB [Streptomyces globisporus]|uniref:Two-component transcriptional response regulator, LuxR family n=1 Tax=Streptomyces globisporus TaxID=1908 RepID=A0ABN8V0K0_STRGL|nr:MULTISPECIES: two-component system response regulator CseB [Streptomyces]RAN26295.1 DNA-binding response regulator [Streptomyces badius]AWL87221.1 DNA-binding response regulator [Streptomyces globisporus]RDL09878.1 DNA-binding response OmpR family regulator [Streptomyces sp. HB202]UIZ14271.1 response regulator transcription factor [Streptomyces sp. R527F]WSF77664.1 response regulator transcription factor [Streptomyces globisporus]